MIADSEDCPRVETCKCWDRCERKAQDERQAKAQPFNWRECISMPSVDEETAKVLDAYFEGFARLPGDVDPYDGKFYVEKGQPCLSCGEALTGFAAMLMGPGGFRWGLVHGEGNCIKCGWPARAHHYVKDVKGADLFTLRNFILQYHPKYVTRKEGT